jgi:hypothetical protein
MIPRAAVSISVSVDAREVRAVDETTVTDGVACIHGYDPFHYATGSWARAIEQLAAEGEALGEIGRQAGDADEYYGLAFEASFEYGLGLELGVSAAVATLNAAACRTFASCGGHDDGVRSDHPRVLFATDPGRAALVTGAASAAGAGVRLDGEGLLIAWTPSPVEMHAFGTEILDRREALDRLGGIVPRPDAAGLRADDW